MKKRLRRPCRECEEMFFPTSKENWMCDNCLEKMREKRRTKNVKTKEKV